MSAFELTTLLTVCLFAGAFGAVLGLGGGIFIVPLLSLWLKVPLDEAAGTGLVVVLSTSAAGSVALDRSGLAHGRLVAVLGLATVIGGIAGASLATSVSPRVVSGLFAAATAWAAVRLWGRAFGAQPPKEPPGAPPPPVEPRRLPVGMGGCVGAGVASGLLGIGGAPVQVPLMIEVMRVPPPVAFATSNIIVGITAAASMAVYYARGDIRADLAAPCALAAAVGAYAGGRLAPRVPLRPLVVVFLGVLVYLTARMLWKAIAPAA